MRNTVDYSEFAGDHEDPFGLGISLGRWQAFGFIAGRCSAADVECLREIRDNKLYRAKTRTWAHFCSRYLGLSRSQADRLLQYLDEFGPNYFHLGQIVRVSPQTYRLISHAVRDDGILFHERPVPLTPENAGRILRAVRQLRREAPSSHRALLPASSAPWKPRVATQADRKITRERIGRLATRLTGLIQKLTAFATFGLEPEEETLLIETVQQAMAQLGALKSTLRR